MSKGLKVLFLSPEAVPFAKSGGLADVAGSLPSALRRLGADVRLVMPFYRMVREGDRPARLVVKDLEVPLGHGNFKCNILESDKGDEIPAYFIEREDLYDRPGLYGNARGDYYDNLERFTFFAHAALKLTQRISFSPGIIHCHDWQTGLVPALLRGPYGGSSPFSKTATIFTIHNMGYQGIFAAEKLPVTGLAAADFFHIRGLEYWGNISLLKAGIVYSDAVTTVSPTYAREIQTSEFGMGMEGVLRGRRDSLYGILNGVDYGLWNPATDPHIPHPYSPGQMAGKRRCKEALIREMGLDPALKGRPLLGMISRLDAQKGLDILLEVLDEMMGLNAGFVLVGSGEAEVQDRIKKAAGRYPGKIGLYVGFHEALAHRIMAGSDIFLVPSRYEPCGLTQMYALKYGTVPVVRATGGLNDTITPFNDKTGQGNGFKFGPFDSGSLLKSIGRAVSLYDHTKVWERIISNGLKADFSWDRSAEKYMEIYRSVLKNR